LSYIITALITALALTILLEFLVYLILITGNWRELLLYSALINALTNPLLNYGYLFLLPNLLVLETVVIIGEVFLISQLMNVSIRSAVPCSICANGLSAFAGILLTVLHLL
jgi:hypothetical protein